MKSLACLALILAASPAAAETVYFQAPSGNVHCVMSDDPGFEGARCDILSVDVLSYAQRPDWCGEDWGQAFFVGPVEPATPVCAGDTVAGDGFVLQYGQNYVLGDVACYSQQTGMECQNGRGSGFQLRRAQQDIY